MSLALELAMREFTRDATPDEAKAIGYAKIWGKRGKWLSTPEWCHLRRVELLYGLIWREECNGLLWWRDLKYVGPIELAQYQTLREEGSTQFLRSKRFR